MQQHPPKQAKRNKKQFWAVHLKFEKEMSAGICQVPKSHAQSLDDDGYAYRKGEAALPPHA